MFDAEEIQTPVYQFRFAGKEHEVDPVLVAYKLQQMQPEGEEAEDPEKLREIVSSVFSVPCDSLQAMALMGDFTSWSKEHLDPLLKKVTGRTLSSPTTTGSAPASTKNSPPESDTE